MARSLRRNDIDNYNGTEVPGYYQRTHLNNIINNFIVAYVGEDKVLGKVPRHEVAFWAQRGVQEFSYDILHSEKSIEVELSDARTMHLPPDYVNYIRVARIDDNGNTITVKPTPNTKPSKGAIQDDKYDLVFDNNGDTIFADESEATIRHKDHRYDEGVDALEYYGGYFYEDTYGYFSRYYTKRFGLQPELANIDYNYMLDNSAGVIYFNNRFRQGDFVTLFYISDGLGDGDDLDNVLVPKLAEDALYAYILYNLSKLRPQASGAAALYGKESSAKMRNAKIRLMNLKSEEMIDVMRGKSKWIKH